MKKHLFLTGVLALFFVFSAFALRFESGDNVRISQPVNEDIYVFGGTISIDAPVFGDIWCAGGTVTISDTVQGDVVVAGGTVYLRGMVLEAVRAAGGTLIISGNIGGDLIVAGGTVTIEPNVVIGKSLAVSGGNVVVGGTVQGFAKAAAGKMTLNGRIDQYLEFTGEELNLNGNVGGTSTIVAKRVNVQDRAALNGNVTYWTALGEVDFGRALKDGATAVFDPTLQKRYDRPDYKFLGFASFLAALWYLLAMFVLIWIGKWLFSAMWENAATRAKQDFIGSLGYGFVYFAVVPIAVVLLCVTLIGIPVGIILLFIYLLLLALANVITALVATYWLMQKRGYVWSSFQVVLVALGLLVVLKMLGFIPVIGWLVKMAAIFTAFGALLVSTGILNRRRSQEVA